MTWTSLNPADAGCADPAHPRLRAAPTDRTRAWNAGKRWASNDCAGTPSPNAHDQCLGDVASSALPIVDKSTVMGAFDVFNGLGLGGAQAWARALGDSEHRPGHDDLAGCSNVVRSRYRGRISFRPGTLLSRSAPSSPRRSPMCRAAASRVGVVLPRRRASTTRRTKSRLLTPSVLVAHRGCDAIAAAPAVFRLTMLVGCRRRRRRRPSRARRSRRERIFSSAEVLDAPDRNIIETAFHVRLGQIDMATEGLFAVSCPHGTLHLAEDAVHFEFEAVAGNPDVVAPIVTDFTRRTQVLARYRMNDLLRLDPAPCPCGSALQPVVEIVGRRDDAFHFPSRAQDRRRSR